MATREEYEAVAPELMAIVTFTATQVNNAVDNLPVPPDPGADPEVTEAKLVQLWQICFKRNTVDAGISSEGGIGKICRTVGLREHQVLFYIDQIQKVVDLRRAETAPPEE